MIRISRSLNFIETAFNIAGSVPLVGVVSGFVRFGLGQLQFGAGVAMGGGAALGQRLTPASKRFEFFAKEGGRHIVHGALNMIRGVGEATAAVTVVGSIIPFTIQFLSPKGFQPRIPYPSEKESRSI